ncbi:unnamed protein product [Caenorhabditis angaria]|uniref:Uncharacterized protein n=1 Tax=Caenorhabditis angaria TaxID=860376 RepID=A0A9P1I5Z8_9PELO|nr:unnamed protein product [Caenorhabditis angaria]
MDKSPTKTNEPIVFHRIRRHSTQPTVPIKVNRGIHQSDGIGSPTDQAFAPPGVVTKIDSIQNRKISKTINYKRMICTNCHNKTNCFCKKCTMEKLKLYSRKENVKLKNDEKNKLLKEIMEYEEVPTNLKNEIAKHLDKIIRLRKKIENAEMRIAMKQVELEKEDDKKKNIFTHKDFKESFASQNRGIERLKESKNHRLIYLSQAEKALQIQRRKYCNLVTNNSNTWAVVSESTSIQGRAFYVRSSLINDKHRMRLTTFLPNGTVCLPGDLHSPFAAITYTVQLVHLFNLIFNFRPPVQINHRDICVRDRWPKEVIGQDWLTICDSIIYLCSYVGIDTKKLKYSTPHANLCEFTNYIIQRQGDISKLGAKPLHDLVAVHKMLTTQRPEVAIRKEEEDESWIFVD